MTITAKGDAICDGCGVSDGNTETNELAPGWTRKDLPAVPPSHIPRHKHYCEKCSEEGSG
jgi:hypothetical protein